MNSAQRARWRTPAVPCTHAGHTCSPGPPAETTNRKHQAGALRPSLSVTGAVDGRREVSGHPRTCAPHAKRGTVLLTP